MVELLYQGQERGIYVYGSCTSFRKWMEGMERPPQAVLWQAIRWVSDRHIADLMRNLQKWKPVKGSKPKLYEIRKDQARLYCCMMNGDVYMLDWVQKKQQRANKNVLLRAERRAKEILS